MLRVCRLIVCVYVFGHAHECAGSEQCGKHMDPDPESFGFVRPFHDMPEYRFICPGNESAYICRMCFETFVDKLVPRFEDIRRAVLGHTREGPSSPASCSRCGLPDAPRKLHKQGTVAAALPTSSQRHTLFACPRGLYSSVANSHW